MLSLFTKKSFKNILIKKMEVSVKKIISVIILVIILAIVSILLIKKEENNSNLKQITIGDTTLTSRTYMS